MNSFELNKILGAVLGTCLILLALNIGAGALFAPEKPANPLYAVLSGRVVDPARAPLAGARVAVRRPEAGHFSVLDLDVRGGRLRGYQYRLLPVFSDLLEPDREMAALIRKIRAPFESRLNERLAVTEALLYRRGNFTGTFDQVILDALLEVKGAEIAFSPGFRWGTTILPGQTITLEHVMDQTAITYPYTTVNELAGETIKNILEDVCDNLFNADPYYQQGGDMVRVGGMHYRLDPTQRIGSRISAMTLDGKPIEAGKRYKVASWAPVAEGASGEPIWEVVARYLRAKKIVGPVRPNRPQLIGVRGNPGIS